MFQQGPLLIQGVNMHLKLVPNSKKLNIKCAGLAGQKLTTLLRCNNRKESPYNSNNRICWRQGPWAQRHSQTGKINYYLLLAGPV